MVLKPIQFKGKIANTIEKNCEKSGFKQCMTFLRIVLFFDCSVQ